MPGSCYWRLLPDMRATSDLLAKHTLETKIVVNVVVAISVEFQHS